MGIGTLDSPANPAVFAQCGHNVEGNIKINVSYHRQLINMTSVVNSLCASCCLKSKTSSSVTRSVTTLCHPWKRASIPDSCCHRAKLTRHTKPPRQPSPVRNAHFSTSRCWHCSTSPTIKSKHPHVLATTRL
jgi:hypothetical protein